MKVVLIWGNWGPYHHARYRALVKELGNDCYGLSLGDGSKTYAWDSVSSEIANFNVLFKGVKEEDLRSTSVAFLFAKYLLNNDIKIVFLPSYWPMVNLILLLVTRLLGRKAIMMNESHALTEKAVGFAKIVKRVILQLFSGALLGGRPQVNHFIRLGMRSDIVFTGYDAVDNEFFSEESSKVRLDANASRLKLGLPDKYILNIGRMVKKKNLSLLVKAYSDMDSKGHSLLLVGTGEEEKLLRDLARDLKLSVADILPGEIPEFKGKVVLFAGFRQIDENPAFYALADAFVLPSHTEEWGLVVNEAMACSLPVLVSKNVGSAEDLVISGENGFTFDPSDHNDLAEKLELLLLTPGLKEKMGAASFSIIQKWGCDNFANQAIKAVECVSSK